MPLDGHSYLVSQGWSGKGTGLRQGAITRPIAISQKKSLAGLGKDRDEAFPFWDHLFSAASKSIQVKISNEDSEHTSDEESASGPTIKRTTTGLLCNRRPDENQTPTTTSGTSTPTLTDIPKSKLSLITLAKREAAKRNLYSRFYRGPVLGPESETFSPSPSRGESSSVDDPQSKAKSKNKASEKEKEKGKEKKEKSSRKKKREADDPEENDEIEKRERKRRKKELKKSEKSEKKKKAKKASSFSSGSEDIPDCADKIERRKRKEERLQRKLELKPQLATPEGVHKTSEKDTDTLLDSVQENTFPKAKKKRRTGD